LTNSVQKRRLSGHRWPKLWMGRGQCPQKVEARLSILNYVDRLLLLLLCLC